MSNYGRIAKVEPMIGADKRLRWHADSSSSWGAGSQRRRLLLMGFEGRLALYSEPVPGSAMPGPKTPERFVLGAEWVDRAGSSWLWTHQSNPLKFESVLPAGAVDRLEEFRAGRRLWARVEGKFFYGIDCDEVPHHQGRTIQLTSQDPWLDYRTEPFELNQHDWGTALAVLRPPGFTMIELHLPQGAAARNLAAATGYLEQAQTHFDAGQWADCLEDLFKCGEALLHERKALEALYDAGLTNLLQHQVSALKGVSNEARHHPVSDKLDRPLALHLLVSTQSALAIYSRALSLSERRTKARATLP